MHTPTRRATNKVQLMNIYQLAPMTVTYWPCLMLIIMMLTVTNLTLTRIEVALCKSEVRQTGGGRNYENCR